MQPGKGGAIQFTLVEYADPEGITLEPVVNGKDKMLYVDISVDGGDTFNVAEVPKLLVK